MTKTYSESDDLSEIFVGRKIVGAEYPVEVPKVEGQWGSYGIVRGTDPVGLLTLDDGSKVYVVGNEGGCSCGAGDYSLTRLATTDNIITSVKVVEPDGEGEIEPPGYADRAGTYSIFVFADNVGINVASFEGDDGNGYYGTGFHLAVVPAA